MPLTPLFPTTALFRSDSPGGDRFVLTLDGVVCGLVTSAQGGTISAPVLREQRGNFIHKRLGAPMPEPIQLSFDLFLNKLVYDWINDSWQGRASAKSGSLIALDANFQARTELQFENAVISATTIPAVDASAQTACVLAVRLNPTATNLRNASGPAPALAPKQRKAWLAPNFRLNIDGLETNTVSSINALTITSGERDASDRLRLAAAPAGAIDFPNLRVLLGQQGSNAWTDWHDQFVVQGKNDDAHEKNGSLVFLAPDLQSQLGSVKFSGLGIYRLTREPVLPSGPNNVARNVAELYCQRMDLVV